MKLNRSMAIRFVLLISLMSNLTILSSKIQADTGSCTGVTVTLPFTDVMTSPFFCQIATAYFSGLTNGTTSTTYSPGTNVTREQMAAFITRTQDSALKRGSRRAALNQWWTMKTLFAVGRTRLLSRIHRLQSDGADLWVSTDFTLQRVRASDGLKLGEYTGVSSQGRGVLVVGEWIFVVGRNPGKLYYVNPQNQNSTVQQFSTGPLPNFLDGIAFDGERIWIGSESGAIIQTRINQTVGTIVTTGFSQPRNLIYDGTNMWASDFGSGQLFKLDANGAILQTVTVGSNPLTMAFDGTNIWVPNYGSNTISVVRAVGGLSGTVIATLSGNGIDTPSAVAFDGERMLVTNENAQSISLFRAADLAPIVSVFLSDIPVGVCSDGINFWIATNSDFTGTLVRY